MHRIILVLMLSGILLGACNLSSKRSKAHNREVIVFAASSVTDVMQEMAREYYQQTGVKVRLNLASSGILARQIEQGARCDIYISANGRWMDYLEQNGAILSKSRRAVSCNKLVAIVPDDQKDKPIEINCELNFPASFTGRLSLGDPTHVPVGQYAMEALRYYHWDKALKDRLLPAKDARDALMIVELGEARMGIVYASDAMKSKKVRVVGVFPSECCSPILYHGALATETSHEGHDLWTFINSEEGRGIWKRNGFFSCK